MSTDYRKWDKFECSEESDDEDNNPNHPNITRIDKPGGASFTIGPQGTVLNSKSTQPPSCDRVIEIGSEVNLFTKNGGSTDSYLWCQERDEVIMRVTVCSNITAKNVNIQFNPIEKSLIIFSNSTVILEGKLRYDVEVSNESSCFLDWELQPNQVSTNLKYLVLTLRKKQPIPGAIIWWKNILVGDPEIDVTQIQGRLKSSAASGDSANVWETAHQMFKEKISKKELISIDSTDEC